MVDPFKGWFKITKYDNKHAITIANLVENTWLDRYPWPTKILHDQESEFIGNEFKNPLIQQEYGIKANPISLGNPTFNATMEIIHLVLGNLLCTYNTQFT